MTASRKQICHYLGHRYDADRGPIRPWLPRPPFQLDHSRTSDPPSAKAAASVAGSSPLGAAHGNAGQVDKRTFVCCRHLP